MPPLLNFEGPAEIPALRPLRVQFGTTQWEDPNEAQVIAVDGQLLYQVLHEQGELREVQLLPRRYVRTVLQLAHTHLLGEHLGKEKTWERITARFHRPGMRRAAKTIVAAARSVKSPPQKHTFGTRWFPY